MDLSYIFDLPSAALIIGGTLLATLLRCGWSDVRAAGSAVLALMRPGFDMEHVRSELGAQIQEIDRDGLVRAKPHHFGDGEFDDVTDALIRCRSVQALYDHHETHRRQRIQRAETATQVLGKAAELGPVLGLAGTLLSLSTLAGGAGAAGNYGGAIGMAVTTTLYGLLLANFLFAPLGEAISRRARIEEQERQELVEWFATAVRRAGPAPEAEPSVRSAA